MDDTQNEETKERDITNEIEARIHEAPNWK